MFNATLHTIAQKVTASNPFFQQSFSLAWEENGTIYAREETGELRAVFPDDRLGDYFYIRQLRTGSISRGVQVAACLPAYDLTGQFRIVASVQKGDADRLLERLIITLAYLQDVRLSGFNGNSEIVTIEEMRSAPVEDIEAALQRIKKGSATVSIDFQLTNALTLKKLNCLPDLCIC